MLKPPAPIYLIHYTDLCEHLETSTNTFYEEKGLCHLMTVGFVKEMEVDGIPCVKVVHYHAMDGSDNSQGIVIQKSVIIKMKRIH